MVLLAYLWNVLHPANPLVVLWSDAVCSFAVCIFPSFYFMLPFVVNNDVHLFNNLFSNRPTRVHQYSRAHRIIGTALELAKEWTHCPHCLISMARLHATDQCRQCRTDVCGQVRLRHRGWYSADQSVLQSIRGDAATTNRCFAFVS